jgi:NADH:ubiquinone oxidoreductase subunit 2 (subunit N)
MKNPSEMNPHGREVSAPPNAQLVDALSGLNAQADLAVVQRTRRAVMAAALQMSNAEVRRRRQVGIVLLAFVGLVVLLTPAIWSVADDLFSGEHFQDMPAMTMSLIVTLFSAIFAALIVHWRSRKTQDEEKF